MQSQINVHAKTLHQVTAAPKKKPKKEEDQSEELKPQSWESKASDSLGELLANAAKARTMSIKLNSVEYAGELSKQLLDHASLLETYYQDLNEALQKKSGDSVLKKLLSKIEDAEAFASKAQAVGWFHFSFNSPQTYSSLLLEIISVGTLEQYSRC